jgi:hypothetical protein
VDILTIFAADGLQANGNITTLLDSTLQGRKGSRNSPFLAKNTNGSTELPRKLTPHAIESPTLNTGCLVNALDKGLFTCPVLPVYV